MLYSVSELGDLVGHETHHDLRGHGRARCDRDGAVRAAAADGEAVAAEPGEQRGQVVVRVHLPRQLVARAAGGVGRGSPELQGRRRRSRC